MDALEIDGCWVLTPRIHRDGRGSFLEWFRESEFYADLGYRMDVGQANCSVSRRGVIRGIHFSDVPPGQAKYITCASGAIVDVVVDLRVGSPGFGRWQAVQLDEETRRALFISEGLGHAFVALSDQATVLYLCSTPYAPAREHGVHALDPAIGIAWPVDMEKVWSDRAGGAPRRAGAQSAGRLRDYAEGQASAARRRSARLSNEQDAQGPAAGREGLRRPG